MKTQNISITLFYFCTCGMRIKLKQHSATETTQAAQATTAAPTAQANNKHQKINRLDNKQSNANSNQQVTAPFKRW